MFMSQITANLIISLIWLILTILDKGCRLVNTIIDIVDDGVINESYSKPSWYQKVCTILSSLQENRLQVESLTDEIRDSVKRE